MTNPPLFENVPRISIADLRRRGALVDGFQVGRLYPAAGPPILYHADLNNARTGGELTLEHEDAQGRTVFQVIELTTVPANRGGGRVWYFRCPVTLDRCRTLYRVEEKYLHRDATPHARYRTQTRSRKQRDTDNVRRPTWPPSKRKMYGGRFTKAYQQHRKKEQQALDVLHKWAGLITGGRSTVDW